VAGLGQRRSCRAAAVGRITQHLDVVRFVGQQIDADGRVAAVRAGGLGQSAGGDQPSVGLDRDMGFEPVLPAVHALVGVPGLRVDDADHPVRCDLPNDPPPRRITRIVRVDEFDVLPGDQREQPDRIRRRTRRLLRQRGEHGQGVRTRASTSVSRAACRSRRSAACRVVVVMRRRHPRDDRSGAGHLAADPRTAAISCVTVSCVATASSEHGRVQRPAGLALERTGLRDHRLHRVKIRFGSCEAASRRRQ
jgi:hypothetical protein